MDDTVVLPSPEELAREEIPMTFNFFFSSAMWLGKYCDNQCKEFMLCRTEEQDPRKCLEYGHKVTDCGLEFFRKVKQTCKDELEWYTKCLDFSGSEPLLYKCRRAQVLFDECMYENGFERAKYGHFQMIRVHDTDRPRPKPFVPIFDDATPNFDVYNEESRTGKGPGGYGSRLGAYTSIFQR